MPPSPLNKLITECSTTGHSSTVRGLEATDDLYAISLPR